MDVGKARTLQTGFDAGYTRVGAPVGDRIGRLRGKIDALLAICRAGKLKCIQDLPSDVRDAREASLERLRDTALALALDGAAEPEWRLVWLEAQQADQDADAVAAQRRDEYDNSQRLIADVEKHVDALAAALFP